MTARLALGSAAEHRTKPTDDPLLATVPVGPLDLDLLIETLSATLVETPDGEKVAAYEVTLKAVLPESIAADLLRRAQNHRVRTKILAPGGTDE